MDNNLIIRRHRSFKNEVKALSTVVYRKSFHHVLTVTTAVSLVVGGYILTRESARGAVGVMLPTKAKKTIVKPPAYDKIGDYTMVVDLSYVLKHNAHGRLGLPYAQLMGFTNNKGPFTVIPGKGLINWSDALDQLWAKKLERKNVSPATRTWAQHVTDTYANSARDTKGIKTFVREVDSAGVTLRQKMDYGAFCSARKIKYCSQFYETMGRIRGPSIAAYGMTELFPSHDGQMNYVAFDTILRNAGENYINSIPSQYDDLLSVGLFQFTSFAVRQDDSGKTGAVNLLAKYGHVKMPGSVVHMSSRDAHRAAVAFATYNIGSVFIGMNEKDANTLAHACPVELLTQAIAVEHHDPKRSTPAIRAWAHAGCLKPLQNYLNPALKEYAIKTQNNFQALHEHLKDI